MSIRNSEGYEIVWGRRPLDDPVFTTLLGFVVFAGMGAITLGELGAKKSTHRLLEQEVFTFADTNRDGVVSFDESIGVYASLGKGDPGLVIGGPLVNLSEEDMRHYVEIMERPSLLHRMTEVVDTDRDGTISQSEFEAVRGTLGKNYLDFLSNSDLNRYLEASK